MDAAAPSQSQKPSPKFTRADGTTMALTICRAVIIVTLYSVRHGGATTELVITTSYNLARDNGVKIADPNGGMLDHAWSPSSIPSPMPTARQRHQTNLGVPPDVVLQVCHVDLLLCIC
jgi:hypothetical protein